MAKILGIQSGLVAGSLTAKLEEQRVESERRTRDAVAVARIVHEKSAFCDCCGGRIQMVQASRGKRWYRDAIQDTCRHCAQFFGRGTPHGPTSGICAHEAKVRIEQAREIGYVMVLIDGHFGDGRVTVLVELGDVFKVARSGAAGALPDHCCWERTKAMHSLEIMIGPVPLILWPHEISPIPFARVMELKRLGELEESYVATEDEHGHFAPPPRVRAKIRKKFGTRD